MRRNLLLLSTLLLSHTSIGAAQPAQTPTAAEVQSWCESVTRAIPRIKVKTCIAAKLNAVAAKSVKGRPIMLREFKPAQDAKGRVLVVGGIHGDELTAVSIVFRWIELLQKASGGAEQYHWSVVPVMNPDGLLAKPPTRVNARGVDLNRNFPTDDWATQAHRYWLASTRRDPRRFPGTAPGSEPESRWLHNEIKRFKPDVIVSVHAPHNVLDFDGPPDGMKAPSRFGRLRLHRLGVFPGSLGNFGGLKEGIPVVTLELPHALNMPTEEELAHVWRDMQQWLKGNLVERKTAASNGSVTLDVASDESTR
jgi:murein peptide amidase A